MELGRLLQDKQVMRPLWWSGLSAGSVVATVQLLPACREDTDGWSEVVEPWTLGHLLSYKSLTGGQFTFFSVSFQDMKLAL